MSKPPPAPPTLAELRKEIDAIDEQVHRLLMARGDIIAANLTVTPARKEFMDFTPPLITGVREVIVTGPASPKLASLDDLSGQEVYVRRSSSFCLMNRLTATSTPFHLPLNTTP